MDYINYKNHPTQYFCRNCSICIAWKNLCTFCLGVNNSWFEFGTQSHVPDCTGPTCPNLSIRTL